MKIIFKGKIKDAKSLPKGNYIEGSTKFKEFETQKELTYWANRVGGVITVFILILFAIRTHSIPISWGSLVGMLLAIVALFPHELIHGLCYKQDAQLYTNLKQGTIVLFGTETFSKTRYMVMTLLPSFVLGFIPFVLSWIFTSQIWLAWFSAFSLGLGITDYYNAYNAGKQMPKEAQTYIYDFHSYWYIPQGTVMKEKKEKKVKKEKDK